MELMETNKEIDDIEEKYIYKNALRQIVELDAKMRDKIVSSGYVSGVEESKCFIKAVSIARQAISEGALRHVRK